MNETIVALATPPFKSALAVIRISGDDAFDIVSKIFTKDIRNITKRTSFIGKIIDGNEVVDEVVLLAYKSPASFTGEDLVEIISHGSSLITNQIIELVISKGARYAVNGEFSSRAFLHNKVDLIQAEAINDVINATSKEAKKLSLLSLDGSTSKLIYPIKTKLADLMSLIEVNIDYPEYEDIEVAGKSQVEETTTYLIDVIDDLVKSGEKGKIVKDGLKVAIVGRPNVGKSSLLNALLNEDKAIVSDIEGTTRDIVEGDVFLDGLTLHLLDTAGIRESQDMIEGIGVSKAKKSILEAEFVLLVIDAKEGITKEDKEIIDIIGEKDHLIIYNKGDLLTEKDDDKIYISAINKDISILVNKIKEYFSLDEQVFSKPSLNNVRQIGLLKSIKENLIIARNDALNDIPLDIVEVSLLSAYRNVLDLLGEDNKIDLSKEIFSRFCVGK
ncbi:MAG: tRNA uridine-5-carboxymethylaminomethyl(34) synthesis GTPase MnmE [Bacilli bacterium]